MTKTVLKVPFGRGYEILKKGNLIERGELAKRYPLVAAATPEEILMAIQSLTLRQVESQLKNFVSQGNRVGSSRVPSLSEFATVVDDNYTEDEEPSEPAEKPVEDNETPDLDKEAADAEALVFAEPSDEVVTYTSDEPAPTAKLDDIAEAAGEPIDTESAEEPVLGDVAEAVAEPEFACDYPGCGETFKSERGMNIHKTKSHPTSIAEAIGEREEQETVARGAVQDDDDDDELDGLDVFAGTTEEDDVFEVPDEDAPAEKPATDSDTQGFLDDLGIFLHTDTNE